MYTRTAGFELEVNTMGSEVARALHQHDVLPDSQVHSYHCRCSLCHSSIRNNEFKAQHDSSLNSGVEIIAPPLSIEQLMDDSRLDKIEAVLCTVGAEINSNCGCHVHVGADDLSTGALSLLHDNYLGFEMVLYYMAIGGQKKHRGTGFAAPWSKSANEYVSLNDQAKLDRLRRFSGHSVGLNFATGYGTVEYRLWNATRAAWRVRMYASTSVLFTELAAEGKSPTLDKYKLRQLPLEAQAAELHLFMQQLDDANARDFVNGVYQGWFESQMFGKPRTNEGNNVISIGGVSIGRPDVEYAVQRELSSNVYDSLVLPEVEEAPARHNRTSCYNCGGRLTPDIGVYMGHRDNRNYAYMFCARCARGGAGQFTRLPDTLQALNYDSLTTALQFGNNSLVFNEGQIRLRTPWTDVQNIVVDDTPPLRSESSVLSGGGTPEEATCDNTGELLDECGCRDCCPDDYCSRCEEENSDCECCLDCGQASWNCECRGEDEDDSGVQCNCGICRDARGESS